MWRDTAWGGDKELLAVPHVRVNNTQAHTDAVVSKLERMQNKSKFYSRVQLEPCG